MLAGLLATVHSLHVPINNSLQMDRNNEYVLHVVGCTCAGSLREFQSSLSYPTGWWRQFTALLSRELKSMTRNPFDVVAR